MADPSRTPKNSPLAVSIFVLVAIPSNQRFLCRQNRPCRSVRPLRLSGYSQKRQATPHHSGPEGLTPSQNYRSSLRERQDGFDNLAAPSALSTIRMATAVTCPTISASLP